MPPRENLTDYDAAIPLAQGLLVNEGWVRGAGEDQVLFVVFVDGVSCGYLTIADDRRVLWIRELYLDGRTWRGVPQGKVKTNLNRGLGKLILAYWDGQARLRGRQLGIFTTHSLGLLKACDHLFGSKALYTVTGDDPPDLLFKQRGLGWLDQVAQFSATLPPHRVWVFTRSDDRWLDLREGSPGFELIDDGYHRRVVVDVSTGQRWGPEDGLQVAIGPSVDILVSG